MKSKARIYESANLRISDSSWVVGRGSSIRLFAQFLFKHDDAIGVCPFF